MDKQKLYEPRTIPELPAPAGDIYANWGTPQQRLVDGFSAAQMDAHAREAWTMGLDAGMEHAPAADETTLPDLARLLGAASKEGKAVKLSAVAAGVLYGAVTTSPAPAAAEPDVCAEMRALCSSCGGTGDVHRIDGEWLGSCNCGAKPCAPASERPQEGRVTLDDALASGELQQLKSEAQALAADGANWSMDVGCMFVLAMIERIEAGAAVYPPDGTVSPFTVINLGSGQVKIGDSLHDGRLPALWFGKDGLGMGFEQAMDRAAHPDETLAVVTFANVEGLDVLAEVVQRIRDIAFPGAPTAGSAT